LQKNTLSDAQGEISNSAVPPEFPPCGHSCSITGAPVGAYFWAPLNILRGRIIRGTLLFSAPLRGDIRLALRGLAPSGRSLCHSFSYYSPSVRLSHGSILHNKQQNVNHCA